MEYLRPGEAAARLGISVATLRRWVEQGRVDAIRLPTTGERRISRETIDRLVAKMRKGGVQE